MFDRCPNGLPPFTPDSSYRSFQEVQTFHRNRNPFTLKVVADSGLARTKGEMRTMPAKWLGLSAAVRMAMAPPCNAKRAELLCAGSHLHTISKGLHGRGPLSLVTVPRRSPWNRHHRMLDKLGLQLFYYIFLPQEQTFQRDTNKVPACGLQVKQYIPTLSASNQKLADIQLIHSVRLIKGCFCLI